MRGQRFRAPNEDGGLLAEPALTEAPDRIKENRRLLDGWHHDFHGRSAQQLRVMARAQVLGQARRHHQRFELGDPADLFHPDGPWIATGHQAELFHPGVWAKNFAVTGLARATGGVGVNLVVDNDVPRSPAIRVPTREGDHLRVVQVPFDTWGGDQPYEDWSIQDPACFASFPDRVREVLPAEVAHPVLEEFWPHVQKAAERTDRAGLRFAAARGQLERDWGGGNLEIPISALCETEAFHWFLAHLVVELPRFHHVHNAALAAYRSRYRIRSRHHPVPALAERDGWREAPFWVWRHDHPRRRPLFVRQERSGLLLRAADENEPFLVLPLDPDREAGGAVERLAELETRGIRLRTRALTTTMFARLLLSDLFFHGIGGAKYDELGDEVIGGFFGLNPPRYGVLSLTVWLPLETRSGSPEARRELERLDRELVSNPDRHLPDSAGPEAAALTAAKRALIARPVATRSERIARFRELRRINERLHDFVVDRHDHLARELERVRGDLAWNTVARGRDYPFVIHSRNRLRSLLGFTGEGTPGAAFARALAAARKPLAEKHG